MRRWGAAEEGAWGGGNFVAVILFRKKKGGGPNPPPPPSSPAAHHTQRAGCSLGNGGPGASLLVFIKLLPPPTPFFGKRIGLSEFNQKRILVPVSPALPSSPRVSLSWRAEAIRWLLIHACARACVCECKLPRRGGNHRTSANAGLKIVIHLLPLLLFWQRCRALEISGWNSYGLTFSVKPKCGDAIWKPS